MTQEEINDYNRRCAQFLGWKQIKDLENINDENEHLKDCWFLPYTELVFWNTEVLKFSTDWNWIMEMVEAIENQLDGTRPFKYGKLDSLDFSIGNKSIKVRASFWTNPNTVDGNYWSFFKYNKKFDKITKKEAVMQAINQFLIWYNEQRT